MSSLGNNLNNEIDANMVTNPMANVAFNDDGIIFDARPNGIKRHYTQLLKQQEIETKTKREKTRKIKKN